MTGLPVARIDREIDPARPPLGRARLPQRARARHRRDHCGRGGRRGARTARRRRAVQRVVGLGRPPWSHEGAPRQPPVVQGRGVRARFGDWSRRARARPLRVLLPAAAQRAVGAQQFARLTAYHGVFRSCNRAFHQDPAQRLDHWCGRCDKCCFIDLVLAPFMDARGLAAVFAGDEPLEDPANEERFRASSGWAPTTKPFECVGDIRRVPRRRCCWRRDATDRADRASCRRSRAVLAGARRTAPPTPAACSHRVGPHRIPERYAPADLLVRAR